MKLIVPSSYRKPNIMFRVWCFFMDSEKGRQKYWDDCHEYKRKHPCWLIDFAPYPGRFHWREWRLIKAYKNWQWKRHTSISSIIDTKFLSWRRIKEK